jgi:hypothetical protein
VEQGDVIMAVTVVVVEIVLSTVTVSTRVVKIVSVTTSVDSTIVVTESITVDVTFTVAFGVTVVIIVDVTIVVGAYSRVSDCSNRCLDKGDSSRKIYILRPSLFPD